MNTLITKGETKHKEETKYSEILHEQVMNAPENIWFHIGDLISVKPAGFSDYAKFLYNFIFQIKDNSEVKIVKHGGELLTRCKVMPDCHIGRAFGLMPKWMMREMFPVLLERQLKYIAELNVSRNKRYYSVNLECLDNDIHTWGLVCDLLRKYGNRYVIVEIKEDAHLSHNVIHLLAGVCRETGIKIYLDDLCKCVHELPAEEEYVALLIEYLAPYIKAVKIDYLTMKKIKLLEKRDLVRRNLECIHWLWLGHADPEDDIPAVIFESMPQKDAHWMGILRELAKKFSGCQYQVG